DEKLAGEIERIGDSSRQRNLREARRLFAKALETPGGLKILTIHGFCQNVLQRFPLEAKVPASFEVLDEQTSRAMMAEARTRMLERAGAGDAPRAAAIAFLLTQRSEGTLNDVLDAALGTDRRKLERAFEAINASGETLHEHVCRTHGATPGRKAADVMTDFCRVLAAEANELRALVRWLCGSAARTDRDHGECLE